MDFSGGNKQICFLEGKRLCLNEDMLHHVLAKFKHTQNVTAQMKENIL